MKVKELIELLSKLDSDMDVVTYCDPNRDYGSGHLSHINVFKGFFEDESKSAVKLSFSFDLDY